MSKKFKNYFKGKKIIVTGHTGFKGSWLALWLNMLGAKVMGISNNVPTDPSHFVESKLKNKIINNKTDIRNLKRLIKVFKKFKPDFIFHLAAQSLVKRSYLDPITTWQTNTIGTLNILHSIKNLDNPCVAVIITSDKSYANKELNRGYKETDVLGGKDPYSASKASAELVIRSYIDSFFLNQKKKKIGVARAGNVIGGGDWSEDRLVPDCIKSWSKSKVVRIRNPRATRPWQHVLEALNGYLTLAIKLKKDDKFNGEAFNFGPNSSVEKTVENLLKEMKKFWGNIEYKKYNKKSFFESKLLRLNSNKAKKKLKWRPILNFRDTIEMTAMWYKNYYQKKGKKNFFSENQIKEYEKKLNR